MNIKPIRDMNIAPRKGEYREVICLGSSSINYVDYGVIEVFEGQAYRECLSGFGFLKENICKNDCILIEIGGYLWAFNKKDFGTLRELRERKLKDLGL